VKIIDLDLARRRISLSIKQAAEGGELAAEYREHFEVDEAGNWTHSDDEVEAAWAEFESADAGTPAEGGTPAGEGAAAEAPAGEAPADIAAEIPADVSGAPGES